jgi:hypothetical protein
VTPWASAHRLSFNQLDDWINLIGRKLSTRWRLKSNAGMCPPDQVEAARRAQKNFASLPQSKQRSAGMAVCLPVTLSLGGNVPCARAQPKTARAH